MFDCVTEVCGREFTASMKLKMVSWNVQGLNDSRKCLVVRNLLREWNCDVVSFKKLSLRAWIDS